MVCNNTNVSKLVFDYIAGWEKPIGERVVVQAGQLPIFRNDDGQGGWLHRPNTILVDSQQLESGEAMSDDFKKIAAREIDEFKAEYRIRFPGRDADNLTDEDLLREVMNTVGKAGKLGEHVKCVVSVSMLTEGWDANTVTHILGVRAFGTQLLCEQVVGRGLRRMSYAANDDGDVRAGVRRGLRRAVLLHPVQRLDRGPQTRPDAHPCARAGEPHRLRDHLPPPARLPLRRGRRAADRDLHRGLAASPSRPPTSRPRPRTRPSSASPASTPSTTSSAAGPTRWPSCWPS